VQVEISGRHVEVTDGMEKHIQRHIGKLSRYDDQIQHVEVILACDSGNHAVEILAKCHRTTLVAEAGGHDMYNSIDQAFAKLEHQVARLHDKLVHKKARDAQRASENNKTASG